jgi:DNA polymerase III subunit chi
MTQVDFHTNVGDKLLYACRLARKAYQAGQPLVVTGEAAVLREFDTQLWTFSALDFIPHCGIDSALSAKTPIVLTEQLNDVPHYGILLNLGLSVPEEFARFERLLEVVGDMPDDLEAGRERYRFYRDRGYSLNSYKATQRV